MNYRKLIPFILVVAAAGLLLAACMNNGTGAQPTPRPTANYAPGGQDGAAPSATLTPGGSGVTAVPGYTSAPGAEGATGNTAATSDGALNPFDWANGAADIEKAISAISEIADARVVVTNSTALVGVKFDNAYKGEMTERIREMVAAEVLKADPGIQTVAVTASEGDVKKVYDLSEQVRAGRTADELSADINAIVRNATTLR